jgi:hypothetical protein
MTDERTYREALFRAAPSHQGGHSDTGAAIAECLGLEFPLKFPDMEIKAKAEGFDPAQLWPWLMKMRRDVTAKLAEVERGVG